MYMEGLRDGCRNYTQKHESYESSACSPGLKSEIRDTPGRIWYKSKSDIIGRGLALAVSK
jgi:hypothetical protein